MLFTPYTSFHTYRDPQAHYADCVHLQEDSVKAKRRLAIDSAIELANDIQVDGDQTQQILIANRHLGAKSAPASEISALRDSLGEIAAIVWSLPGAKSKPVVEALNSQLRHCQISPHLLTHDGSPLHIHWTAADASFRERVLVDVLMTLVAVVSEHGIEQFGRCDASGCERVFFDHTTNRTRRFCSDAKCASRTHTAAHRKRLKP